MINQHFIITNMVLKNNLLNWARNKNETYERNILKLGIDDRFRFRILFISL